MGQLVGLQAYLDVAAGRSVFDQALASRTLWTLHLHGQRLVQATIVENRTYDLKVDIAEEGRIDLPKIQVKCLYPAELSAVLRPLIKVDKKVAALGLGPIFAPTQRHF